MPRLEPLWLILATLSDKQLGQTVEFLREENRIRRGKLPARIEITPRDRSRLSRYGRKLGTDIRSVITTVPSGGCCSTRSWRATRRELSRVEPTVQKNSSELPVSSVVFKLPLEPIKQNRPLF